LTSGLVYRGEVEAKRQTYHVFEGKKHFFVMSLSRAKRNAGNFNIVSADAVEYVATRFAGRKGVTSTGVASTSRTPRHVKTSLDALNILYVLVATERAKIDPRYKKERQLFFNVTR
jgi:hypothetical protein